MMKRFIEDEEREQLSLLPTSLDDYVEEDHPIRVINAFIDELDLSTLGFTRVQPAATGRPGYHPATLLKLYLYGYLNRVQSSRRLEHEAKRNVEVMWLTGRLAPDFKTIADFCRDNGTAIQAVRRLRRQYIAQNVTKTLAPANMFSELRKYRVGVVLVHQYLHQLDVDIREAAIGNAGTFVSFRIGASHAGFVAREFAPIFDMVDLQRLPNHDIYLKLMIDGAPPFPFSATTMLSNETDLLRR